MLISRRGFMQSILALAAAPALVRAQSLMPSSFRARTRFIYNQALFASTVWSARTSEIDITNILDTAKSYMPGLVTYETDSRIVLPHDARLCQLYVNGKEIHETPYVAEIRYELEFPVLYVRGPAALTDDHTKADSLVPQFTADLEQ